MKSDRPSFQFYPDDWLSNSNLRRCTHEEKGIWMDILCILHDQEEYGVIRWPLKEVAKAIGASASKVRSIVNKGVMKGVDSGDTVDPLIYIPRSGRREGKPVTLVAEQKGPIWYSSRMIIDEYKRMVRGGGEGAEPLSEIRHANFGATIGASPKDTPKPSPKGGIGEGEKSSGDLETTNDSACVSLVSSHGKRGGPVDENAAEMAQNSGEKTSKKPATGQTDSERNFCGILEKFSQNFNENPKKSSSTFCSESEQNHDENHVGESDKKNNGHEHGNALINNISNENMPSPKGGIGEGIGEGIGDSFGVPFGDAPKLHLTLHPSRARPSSSSSSSSSKEKKLYKKSGEHSELLPTESADSENDFSSLPSAPSETDPRLGDQNETSAHEDASGQHPPAREDSARNIRNDITPDGNIEKIITPVESAPKYPDGFEPFWEAYPVHVGKKPCAVAWAKKRLQGRTAEILADIALRKKKNRRWLDGYYANPLTYLNQELWMDDWASSPTLCVAANASERTQTESRHGGSVQAIRPPVTRL